MGCWTARIDIHCLWSAWKPSLDASSRWEELPCASFRQLWVSLSHFSSRLTLELLTKYKIWVSSRYGKLGAELRGGTSTAYELFQNLSGMQKEDWRKRWLYLSAAYGSYCHILLHSSLSNCTQNARFSISSQSVSVHNVGCCATRRVIYCSWSPPKPSMYSLCWGYEPPCASFCYSWVSPTEPFFTQAHSQNAQKMQILSTLS